MSPSAVGASGGSKFPAGGCVKQRLGDCLAERDKLVQAYSKRVR